jgi:hypothetical protein
MVSITNERGEEVTRQIVGVGAMQPGEQRKFTFAVEVFTPDATATASAAESPLPARLRAPRP